MPYTKETLDKLKKLFHNSLEGVVIADMQQDDEPIIYCNRTFSLMTGYEPEEVIGKNCRFLQDTERNQSGSILIRQAINSGQPCKVVLRNFRKDGSLFYNRLSIFPVNNDDGRPIYYIGIQDDVTDLIQTRDRLLRSERDNDALLAEVHHRVKNNLAVISAMLDLESYKEFSESAIEKSKVRVKSMSMLHEQIYQIGGLSSIRFDEHLVRITKNIQSEYADKFPDPDVHLDISPLVLTVNQAMPLTIALVELIDNIFKHAFPNQDRGMIKLSLKENDGKVVIKLSDNGVGLSGEFDPINIDTTGWLICLQSMSQIDAMIEDNKPESGTSFTISFDKKNINGSSQNRKITIESIEDQ